MAHSFLIFDFGSNEEAAQQARHRVEGWIQGFRLGKKLLVKFDRGDEETSGAGDAGKADASSEKQAIVVMVRLDFSDHEKLSHQRWLERIPSEALFRDAHPKMLRQGDPEFASAAERFDALPDSGAPALSGSPVRPATEPGTVSGRRTPPADGPLRYRQRCGGHGTARRMAPRLRAATVATSEPDRQHLRNRGESMGHLLQMSVRYAMGVRARGCHRRPIFWIRRKAHENQGFLRDSCGAAGAGTGPRNSYRHAELFPGPGTPGRRWLSMAWRNLARCRDLGLAPFAIMGSECAGGVAHSR